MRAVGRKARSAMRAAPYRFAVGAKGSRVVVTERADRSGRLEIRYTDTARLGRDRRVKKALDVSLRSADGSIRADMAARVERLAKDQEFRLRHRRAPGLTSLVVDTLTLGEGVALALDTHDQGVFLGGKRQRKDAERYLRRLVTHYLDPDVLWDQLLPMDVESAMTLWLKDTLEGPPSPMKKNAHAAKDAPRGFRSLQVGLSAFEKTAKWLRQNRKISSGVPVLQEDWRRVLHRIWEKETGSPYSPRRPRHTTTEVASLFSADEAGEECDPRFRLAFKLGAELRIGQLLLLNRSDVDLAPAYRNPFGTVQVPTCGSKPGSTIGVDETQHACCQAAFETGYLRELEAAWQAGELSDYPMFPGGKLRKGVAPHRARLVRWGRRAALKAFHKLELAAMVPNLKGRGWLGVRRAFSDVAPLEISDPLILEQMAAHSVGTQNKHYRDRAHPELVARARTARTSIRERIRSEGHDGAQS